MLNYLYFTKLLYLQTIILDYYYRVIIKFTSILFFFMLEYMILNDKIDI